MGTRLGLLDPHLVLERGYAWLTDDTGRALTLKPADLLSNIAVWGPIPLAVLFFVALFATGRISL